MHASEARKLAEANVTDVLSGIIDKITDAADRGYMSVTLEVPSNYRDVERQLVKLGYRVKLHWDPRGGHDDSMMIGW